MLKAADHNNMLCLVCPSLFLGQEWFDGAVMRDFLEDDVLVFLRR